MTTQKLQVVDTALPQSQELVIERLLAEFDELPGQLQLCARYIIDHPHEVGLQSMRTLAQAADVHPNSFVRLARQLGFDGYEAMRSEPLPCQVQDCPVSSSSRGYSSVP